MSFTDGGDVHWLLGIEIKRDRNNRTIYLRQKHYIKNILQRFKLDTSRMFQTPMLPNTMLHTITEQTEEEKNFQQAK